MAQDFFHLLLDYFQISEEEYHHLNEPTSLDSFSDGYSFKNIEEAVKIAKSSISNKEKILVYGDYDADGIMGTSILVKIFKHLNYDVSYYIPSRYLDGYGLTVEKAKKAIGKFDLVITVDNGIVATEAIQILKDNNIKVIVIDHHTVQLPLPNADAIVHPEVSEYGDVTTSGAYCAFMFSIAMLGYADKYLATLAAISLISDMMPLKKYNRKLLQAVFKDYKDNEFLQISLLAEHKDLDENVIGLSIAPKINAIGRMIEDSTVNYVVKYFVTDDIDYILTYFNYMESINEQRKIISKEASNNILKDLKDDAMVSLVDIKEGLIGLIANSIMNKINKPAIVFTKDNSGLLKGSARSVEGFNIVEAFKNLEKYMNQFGGHALAGGCSIKEENYENFKKDFISLVNSSDLKPLEKPHIDISLSDINYDNYLLLKTFSPFGENWKAPLFKINHIKVSSLTFSKTKEHILTKIGNNSKLVGFYISEDSLKDTDFINISGKLNISVFKNIITTEFHIEKVDKIN